MGLKLLLVTAHPDDECFAFGGVLALAADAGLQTHLVCFTDGQAASYRGTSRSAQELGLMRRAELAASCEILGVHHHEVWDYQDGQLEFANFSVAAGRLVAKIRDLKPDVVLTFGSDGAVNTHPDHTMVSAFTCAAVHWAAMAKRFPDAGPTYHVPRLFILTTSFFLDNRPSPMPAPWTVTLDIRSVMARKHQAFAAHTTQMPLVEQTKTTFEQFGQTEHYTLLATSQPGPASQMTSLFDGLDPQS